MENLDVRGFSCPEPVLRTEKLVKEGKTDLEILVDTNVSKENVSRYLEEEGYTVTSSPEEDYFVLKAKK